MLDLVIGIQEKCCKLEASSIVNIQTWNVFVLTNTNHQKKTEYLYHNKQICQFIVFLTSVRCIKLQIYLFQVTP